MIKEHVIAACRRMLGPVVRLLIRNGVTWQEFAELGKEVYVDIARRDYGLQGRPTNNARVALITGLSRREVTRVRAILTGEKPAQQPTENRISVLLGAWHLDPDFLDAEGHPAALEAAGDIGSINHLLKRYAGDLPHGALLKEMLQLGLIEFAAGRYRVLARSYIRNPADPSIVRQAGRALHDHAATLTHNLDAHRAEPPRFERMATTPRLKAADLGELRSLIEKRGQAFLEDVDAWLAEHTVTAENHDTKTVRAGVGVYLIRDDERSDE